MKVKLAMTCAPSTIVQSAPQHEVTCSDQLTRTSHFSSQTKTGDRYFSFRRDGIAAYVGRCFAETVETVSAMLSASLTSRLQACTQASSTAFA